MKNYYKNSRNSGITLIALVITIIVLVILAGVSINLVLGNNGIIEKTKEAKQKNNEGQVKESVELMLAEYEIAKTSNETLTVYNFLQGYVQKGEIDEVTNNEDGTFSIQIKDYEVTVSEANGKIIGTYNGPKPKVEITIPNSEGIVSAATITVNVENVEGVQVAKIIKPDGSETTETSFVYNVSQNGEYIFKIVTTEGRVINKKVNVTNVAPQGWLIKDGVLLNKNYTWSSSYNSPYIVQRNGYVEVKINTKSSLEVGMSWKITKNEGYTKIKYKLSNPIYDSDSARTYLFAGTTPAVSSENNVRNMPDTSYALTKIVDVSSTSGFAEPRSGEIAFNGNPSEFYIGLQMENTAGNSSYRIFYIYDLYLE